MTEPLDPILAELARRWRGGDAAAGPYLADRLRELSYWALAAHHFDKAPVCKPRTCLLGEFLLTDGPEVHERDARDEILRNARETGDWSLVPPQLRSAGHQLPRQAGKGK